MSPSKDRLSAGATSSRAGSLVQIGGALCLNFVNTSSGRGSAEHQDHLKRFEHLLAWATHAGAIDETTAMALVKAPTQIPRQAARVFAEALTLRESLYVLFSAAVSGKTPAKGPLDVFNSALSRTMAAGVIEHTKDGYAWRWPIELSNPERLLWPVVRSAAELLTEGKLNRVKTCAGRHCGWLFLDTTRNGRRRWCEMEVCGSRAKMRRYHERRRAAALAGSPF